MPILINTTVFSNFAAVARLDLLRVLYGTVYIAYPVYEELQMGLEEGYDFLSGLEAHIFPFHTEGWLHLASLEGEAELALYENAPAKLHRGEAMSLAIAAHRGWQFLTDDRAARLHAIQMGVSIGGTLGILVRLVKQGLLALTEANDILEQMTVRANYRSPVSDLSVWVGKAQE
jgi:predicted nucleic acid-binding protein